MFQLYPNDSESNFMFKKDDHDNKDGLYEEDTAKSIDIP